MERDKKWKYHRAVLNRYAQNHATNLMANPTPGKKYSSCRILARAVILQALRDAVDAEEEKRRRFERFEQDPEWVMIHRYYDPYSMAEVRIFKNIYGIQRTWMSCDPEPVRFFKSEDYLFYADMAGIAMSGEHLLKQFKKRRNSGVGIDQLIDG